MKKIIAIMSALAMMLALASCGGDTAGASSGSASGTGTPSATPSVNVSSSAPEVSQPPVVEENDNLALSDKATWIDMNTGKTKEDADYLAYYGDAHIVDLAFNGSYSDGWQIKTGEATLGEYTEGETEVPEGAYVASDGKIYNQEKFEDGKLWMGVSFSEAVAIDTVVVVWEAGSMPLAYEDGSYRYEYTTDGTTWVVFENATVTRDDGTAYPLDGSGNIAAYGDTVTFEAIEVTGVRVVVIKGSTKYAPKVLEMEILAPEETEEVESTDETTAE